MVIGLDRAKLSAQLIRHEAMKLRPYIDPAGKITIGVGRNLDDTGITADEAAYLLDGDISRTIRGLAARYPAWFPALDPVRQAAVTNMAFNLGIGGFSTFTTLIAALTRGDFNAAADAMIQSLWAKQVGYRALELSEQMRSGEWA